MLYSHPKILSEPLWVRFTELGDMSHDIDVFAYIGVATMTNRSKWRRISIFRILDIVTDAGTELAIPCRSNTEWRGSHWMRDVCGRPKHGSGMAGAEGVVPAQFSARQDHSTKRIVGTTRRTALRITGDGL